MGNLIELREVSRIYTMGENQVKALDRVSLTVKQGEYVSVVGSSGSGKSTLMNILGCLDMPTEGEYLIDGENAACLSDSRLSHFRGRHIGFIFQGFHLIPTLTAQENVELPLLYQGVDRTERKKLAEEALKRVGLEGRMSHRPAQMSGGQQQRVAIARAVAARPPVILADEPTGNLDSISGAEVTALLRELHQEGRTVILITHDDTLAQQTDRKIRIHDGHIIEDTQKH